MNNVFDEIIKKLEEKSKGYLSTYTQAIIDAKKIVQEVEKEYNNGWILCSSEIPEEDIPVDVTVREEGGEGGYEYTVMKSLYRDGDWTIRKNKYNPTVIAWKPSTEPYIVENYRENPQDYK